MNGQNDEYVTKSRCIVTHQELEKAIWELSMNVSTLTREISRLIQLEITKIVEESEVKRS